MVNRPDLLLDLNALLSVFDSYEYETGGIIMNSNETNVYVFDEGLDGGKDTYIPNIKRLNHVLRETYSQGLLFVGLIHSHRVEKKLSYADVYYARKIMSVNELDELLMPIYVLQNKELIWYKVFKDRVEVI